jgi:hypothetical protein
MVGGLIAAINLSAAGELLFAARGEINRHNSN